MTVRINKQKINLREKLAGVEDKVNFDEVVRGLGEYGGNVGIGTTNPGVKLEVVGDNSADFTALILANNYATDTEGDVVELKFRHLRSYSDPARLNDSAFIKAVKEVAWDSTGNRKSALTFGTRLGDIEPAEKMRIDSAGNVGIGTTNPAQKLHVHANATNTYAARINNTAGTNANGLIIDHTNNAADNNSTFFLTCQDSSAVRMRIYSDGDVWTSDSGTLTSDERLKTNIVDATPKLEDIKKLKVRNFEWVPEFHPAKEGEKKIGFIAQELEEVFPGLVDEHDMSLGEEEIKRKSVRMGALIPILVKGMQEQQQLIDDLKSRIETLEQQ